MKNNFNDYNNPVDGARSFFQDRNLKNNIGFLCIVLSIFSLLRCYEVVVDIANKKNAGVQSVISGRGIYEIKLTPDIGNFSFVVRVNQKTAKEAHQRMVQKVNNVIVELYNLGISKEDIQVENYVSRPKYFSEDCQKNNCQNKNQMVEGFEASQEVFVKVRDIKKSGDIISVIAQQDINQISPINYEIEDLDKFKEKAREQAVNIAREDAKNIAKSLGIRLKKVIKYSESDGNDFDREHIFKKHGVIDNRDDFASTVNIIQNEKGEQIVRSKVVITYQIN